MNAGIADMNLIKKPLMILLPIQYQKVLVSI